MLVTSPKFRDNMHADEREVKALVEINFRPGESIFATGATASSQLDQYSAPSMCLTNRLYPQPWKAEGVVLDYMRPASNGWRSKLESTEVGILEEWLAITYNRNVQMDRIWFSSFLGYQPENFTVDVYTTEWVRALTVVGNEDVLFSGVFDSTFEASRVRINITKIPTPHNNVRIMSFGIPSRLLLGEDDIEDFTLLEESSGEDSNPLGTVTANELTIGVGNEHRWYTPANAEGPFAKLLRPGVELRPYIGVRIDSDTFEYIPLGIFRTTDWSVPSDSLSASLVGLDRLYVLSKQPTVKLPVMENVTIAYLFSLLFRAYGLSETEYRIDASLDQKVAIGWIPKGSMIEALQELSEAGNCSVATDREDRIRVRNNFIISEVSERYAADEGVVSLTNPISYSKTYSAVKVTYKIPTISTVSSELLSINTMTFPPGVTLLKDLAYQKAPVKQIDSVLFGAATSDLRVKTIRTGAWLCDIEVENSGWKPVESSVVLKGLHVELISTDATTRFPSTSSGLNIYEFSSDLIQDARIAGIYGNAILTLLQDPASRYQGELRGNPALEIYDTIEMSNAMDKVGNASIVPTRIELVYDGGFTMMVEGRKPVRPTQRIFLNACHNVLVDIPITDGYYK